MRVVLRNGLEGSSEEIFFYEEFLQDDREEIENNIYYMYSVGQILDWYMDNFLQLFEIFCLLQIFDIVEVSYLNFQMFFNCILYVNI